MPSNMGTYPRTRMPNNRPTNLKPKFVIFLEGLGRQLQALSEDHGLGKCHCEIVSPMENLTCLEVRLENFDPDQEAMPTYRIIASGIFRTQSMVRISNVDDAADDHLVSSDPNTVLRVVCF